MKSLHKALDILEYVLNLEGKPVTPGKAAEAIGLNECTCVRIMGEMVKRGYLEKVSRKAGYIPGPTVFALSNRDCGYSRLIGAAEIPIREFAIKISSMVNISVMHDKYRYILRHYSAHPERKLVHETSYFSNCYETATGWLLLSVSSDEIIEKFIKELGVPQNIWNDLKTENDMRRKLNEIKNTGLVEFPHPNGKWHIMGALIKAENCPLSAIGFGIDVGDDAKRTMSLMKECVREIEDKLASRESAF
ncbi:MAG: hypothetical protein A2017_06785 [Lentisphaerae bacterium GWF2_44_16]|nr:MAG: hypothetical protein A2017_06785 [Lentisphaerae bacterium GWF2_44_16]